MATNPFALDATQRDSVVKQAQDLASKSGKSAEEELWNYGVANGIDAAGIDTYMGYAPGTSQNWAVQNGKIAAPQGNYNPGQAVKATTPVQTGIINSASNAAPNKPQPLGADQRALVVQRATDIGKSQGFSPEQALVNYARANNIDNAGIDTYMGYAPGTADAWEISNNKSKGIVGSAMSSALPTPGATQWSVSPDMTVQSQLKNVMDQNSPLMQQAKTQGLQMANDRGLLNSSIAESAAMDSMYKAALPIAAADAATYAKSASENAGNATNITNSNTSAATSIATNAANNDTSRANTAANNATTVATNAANNETSRANAKLQTDAAAALGLNDAEYKKLTQASSSAAQLMTNYQSQVAAMLRDTSFGDTASRQAAIDQLTNATKAAIQMIGATAGNLDIADYMSQLFPAEEGKLAPASLEKW